MATGNARRFAELGLGVPLAKELAAQITAGTGNARRLIELGMMPGEARRVVQVIAGTTVPNNKLAESGMIPRVIRELKSQVGGSSVTPFPQLGSMAMRLEASSLVGQVADGAKVTPSTPFTDAINGAQWTQATSANQPTFQAAGYLGKPTLRCPGAGTPVSLNCGRNAAMVALLDGTTRTLIAVVANVTTGNNTAMVLAAFSGTGVCYLGAGSTSSGVRRYGISASQQNGGIPLTDTGLVSVGHTQSTASNNVATFGVYNQGSKVDNFSGRTTAATGANNISLLGTNDNQANAAFQGDFIALLGWSVALTPSEMIQAQKAICDRYGTPGVYPWTGRKYYIFDGDSQTEGFGCTAPEFSWPNIAMAGLGVPLGSYTITALSGVPMDILTTRAPLNVDPIPAAATGATSFVLTNLEWYNQSQFTAPAQYNSSIAYLNGRRSANPTIKIAFIDSLDAGAYKSGEDTTTFHTKRASYNASLLSSSAPADVLIRLSLDANIGVDGSFVAANAFVQADLIHPTGTATTGTGHARMATLISPIISGL